MNGRTVPLHEVEGGGWTLLQIPKLKLSSKYKNAEKMKSRKCLKAQTWFRVGCCSTLTLSIHTCILNLKPQCYRIPSSKRQRYRIPSNSFKLEKRIKPLCALELNWLEMYSDDIWLLKWILRKANTIGKLSKTTWHIFSAKGEGYPPWKKFAIFGQKH